MSDEERYKAELLKREVLIEFYEAYLLTRQRARKSLKLQLDSFLNFLEEEEKIFERAAKNIRQIAVPSLNGNSKDKEGNKK